MDWLGHPSCSRVDLAVIYQSRIISRRAISFDDYHELDDILLEYITQPHATITFADSALAC